MLVGFVLEGFAPIGYVLGEDPRNCRSISSGGDFGGAIGPLVALPFATRFSYELEYLPCVALAVAPPRWSRVVARQGCRNRERIHRSSRRLTPIDQNGYDTDSTERFGRIADCGATATGLSVVFGRSRPDLRAALGRA